MRPETSRRELSHRIEAAPRPASTLGCEELRRLAKGCPAPIQTSGQPPAAPGRAANPKKKKCSLGLQVSVDAAAGAVFGSAANSCGRL